MDNDRLGRGHGRLRFYEHAVVKRVPRDEAWQPGYMIAHDDCFVPVTHVDRSVAEHVEYTMPRGLPPDPQADVERALLDGLGLLQATLWRQRPTHAEAHDYWKMWLEQYLLDRIRANQLDVPRAAIPILVNSLPLTATERYVHGDATLANLVFLEGWGWRWIDPLVRKFIPWDPLVDMGKMLQSCWGYERVIIGELTAPTYDAALADKLCSLAGLQLADAKLWLMVHALRLLPYQEAHLRPVFTRWLNVDLGLAQLAQEKVHG